MTVPSDDPVEAQALTTAELEAFERDWADLEAHIAAIQSGAVEAPEVIEHLDELDVAAEDAAPAKAEPEAIAPTEDIEPAKAEPEPAVVEPPGELDAAGLQAVEGAIAVAEAYEVQPDKLATARTVEIQAYLAKQPKRGGARPAACKEFGVDPTDPLAEDKVRVAGVLKKFKATLADLEVFWPGYWALPRKQEGKDDKGEPFPSRALVLKKFEWRRYNEITSAESKKLKESARLKRREAKIVAKGWRADFYDLSPADQKRERDKVWRQNKRTS